LNTEISDRKAAITAEAKSHSDADAVLDAKITAEKTRAEGLEFAHFA
jgi:hypothetical protein